MTEIKCENSLNISPEHQKNFDVNNSSCLEIDELEKLSLPNPRFLDSNDSYSLDLFLLNSNNIEGKKAIDIFFNLSDQAKIRFFRNSTNEQISKFGKLISENKPKYLVNFTQILAELRYTEPNPVKINPHFNSKIETIAFLDSIQSDIYKPKIDPNHITSKNYPDINSALSKSLRSDYQILAFGEYHPQVNFEGVTAHSTFAEEIIPAVSEKYNNLVLEFLPFDIAQSEIDHYIQTGRISKEHTPRLITSLSLLQDRGKSTVQILEAARANNIKVYGGGVTLSQIALQVLNLNTKSRFEMIKDNSASQIRTISERGEKVMFYGGTSHNTINGKPAKWSFGKDLASDFTYAEIDIVVPDEHIKEIQNKKFGAVGGITNLKTYRNHINHLSGIQLAKSKEGVIALILPMTNDDEKLLQKLGNKVRKLLNKF